MIEILRIVAGLARFAARHWVWIVMAAALLAANHYRDQSANRLARAEAGEAKLAATEQTLTEWQAAYNLQVTLALETAKARAAEQSAIITIRDAAGTAKQEIQNAPGADDPFRYSDGAYRFMRPPAGAVPDPAAANPPDLGRR